MATARCAVGGIGWLPESRQPTVSYRCFAMIMTLIRKITIIGNR